MRLNEVSPFEYRIVEKRKRPGILMTLEGKLQHAGVENQNKRLYPVTLWDKLLENDEVKSRITNREMVGTLGHPASGATDEEKISHVITNLYKKSDGEIWGNVDVLDTPHGQIAAKLFEAKVRIGASSRGDGSTVKNGDIEEVQDDYALETFDLVLKPSTFGAFPQITESVQDRKENDTKIVEALDNLIDKSSDLDVLFECDRISGLLESSNNLRSKIKTKLIETRKDLEPNNNESLEESMDPKESKDTINYIKEQVDKGIAEAIGIKESEIVKLNKQIVELTTENKTLAKKVEAAEKLINGFTAKLRELKEHKNTDTVLQKRYAAATKLLEAALKKLKESGKTSKRLAAAEKLLSASVNKHKRVAVDNYINKALSSLPENVRPKFAAVLGECKTPSDVNRKLTEVKALISVVAPKRETKEKEPLPPKGGRKVMTESQGKGKRGIRESVKHSDPITATLLKRFS
jgi:hypothetical protein